jgi:AAA+ ATPase superfamily predicted ATPase
MSNYEDFARMFDTEGVIPTELTTEIMKNVRNNGANKKFNDALQHKFQEAKALLLQKHEDYGPTNISNAPGGPLNGLRVRIHDKSARINHLLDSGVEPKNESLRDSFIDMANYAIIALMVIDGDWPEK